MDLPRLDVDPYVSIWIHSPRYASAFAARDAVVCAFCKVASNISRCGSAFSRYGLVFLNMDLHFPHSQTRRIPLVLLCPVVRSLASVVLTPPPPAKYFGGWEPCGKDLQSTFNRVGTSPRQEAEGLVVGGRPGFDRPRFGDLTSPSNRGPKP
jgi:hypothetical protein